MPDVVTLYNTLTGTPLPNILVITGIIFLFLAIVGQFAWQIRIGRKQQILSGVLGVAFLGFGVSLYLPPPVTPISTPTITPISTPTITPTSVPLTITPSIQDVNIEPIVGKWRGSAEINFHYSLQVTAIIEEPCKIGLQCGSIELHEFECKMHLRLVDVTEKTYIFSRERWVGNCTGGQEDTFQVFNEDQIVWVSGGTVTTLQRIY